jgi:hypothetical protein
MPTTAETGWLDELLPADARRELEAELVEVQLEELNVLGDRLVYLAANEGTPEQLAAVRARCDLVVEALRWNREAVVEVARAWARRAHRHEEDLFAAGLILARLGEAAELEAWRQELPEATRQQLDVRFALLVA